MKKLSIFLFFGLISSLHGMDNRVMYYQALPSASQKEALQELKNQYKDVVPNGIFHRSLIALRSDKQINSYLASDPELYHLSHLKHSKFFSEQALYQDCWVKSLKNAINEQNLEKVKTILENEHDWIKKHWNFETCQQLAYTQFKKVYTPIEKDIETINWASAAAIYRTLDPLNTISNKDTATLKGQSIKLQSPNTSSTTTEKSQKSSFSRFLKPIKWTLGIAIVGLCAWGTYKWFSKN